LRIGLPVDRACGSELFVMAGLDLVKPGHDAFTWRRIGFAIIDRFDRPPNEI
jgi:hypothetical protein